jgi:hypothetical protein
MLVMNLFILKILILSLIAVSGCKKKDDTNLNTNLTYDSYVQMRAEELKLAEKEKNIEKIKSARYLLQRAIDRSKILYGDD